MQKIDEEFFTKIRNCADRFDEFYTKVKRELKTTQMPVSLIEAIESFYGVKLPRENYISQINCQQESCSLKSAITKKQCKTIANIHEKLAKRIEKLDRSSKANLELCSSK